MISRVAENCFWLSRYMERIESLARLLDVNLTFQLDVDLPNARRWRPLVIVVGEERSFGERIGAAEIDDAEQVQRFLVWNEAVPASISNSLYQARENARTVRETVSLEMWETINDLWLWFRGRTARNLYERDRHAFYAFVRDRCVLYQGFTQLSMLLEEPFDFMRLGSALERANLTARILDVKYHGLGPTRADVEMPAEAAQWLAILRSCAAVEPFFKRTGRILGGPAVAEFLCFERTFPRSVLHNLDRARNFLNRIRLDGTTGTGEESAKRLAELLAAVERLTIEEVLDRSIHEVMTWIVDSTARICDAIHRDFFDPSLEFGQRQWQIEREPPGALTTSIPAPGREDSLSGSGGGAADAGRTLDVVHRTVYGYAAPVEHSTHLLRLRPVDDPHQRVIHHTLELSVEGERVEYEDVFGNHVAAVEITSPFKELAIESRSRVRIDVRGWSAVGTHPHREEIPLVWMPWQRQMLLPYLLPPELPESELRELSKFAMGVVERNDYDLEETLLDLNRSIHRDFTYRSGSTGLDTTPYEVYAARRGVCQDFANLLMCLARLLQVPARYRVGYLFTGDDPSKREQSEASHAWAELYLPRVGWRGFDPTNGCLAGRDHVRVACGRNYRDATPTSGTLFRGGGGESLSVSVRVAPVGEGAPGSGRR